MKHLFAGLCATCVVLLCGCTHHEVSVHPDVDPAFGLTDERVSRYENDSLLYYSDHLPRIVALRRSLAEARAEADRRQLSPEAKRAFLEAARRQRSEHAERLYASSGTYHAACLTELLRQQRLGLPTSVSLPQSTLDSLAEVTGYTQYRQEAEEDRLYFKKHIKPRIVEKYTSTGGKSRSPAS